MRKSVQFYDQTTYLSGIRELYTKSVADLAIPELSLSNASHLEQLIEYLKYDSYIQTCSEQLGHPTLEPCRMKDLQNTIREMESIRSLKTKRILGLVAPGSTSLNLLKTHLDIAEADLSKRCVQKEDGRSAR